MRIDDYKPRANALGNYIYREDFAQQYDKCGARSGSPQLYSRDLDFLNDLECSLSNVCYYIVNK